MYKLTNVKKCKEKGVHIAFEPFIWLAASSKDGKLKELEMKLTEEPPCKLIHFSHILRLDWKGTRKSQI